MEPVIPASTELIAIIERNFESKALDYKGPLEWNPKDKKSCCELVKDVIAIANTDGGHLVIGVAERDEGFSLDGLSSSQAGTFESSTICRFIQNYVDPPINVTVQKVSHKSKLFVVLEVPRFADTPHLCQKDYPEVLRAGSLYIRTDNNESASIKSSADFRRVVEAAIRNRTDSLLTSFRSILTSSSSDQNIEPTSEAQFMAQIQTARDHFKLKNPLADRNYEFFVETIFTPRGFDQYKYPPGRLRQAAYNAAVEFTGWPFLFIYRSRPELLIQTEDGLELLICSKDYVDHDILDFWKFNESGLFYKIQLQPDSASNPPRASAPAIIRHFAEALFCLARLYEGLLSATDVVSVSFILLGTRGRSLTWGEIGFISSSYTANRPTIKIEAAHTLAEWRAGLEDHVVELVLLAFRAFQLDSPDTLLIRTHIRDLFRRKFI